MRPPHQRRGEAGHVKGDIELRQDVGRRADVVLMTVRENQSANVFPVLENERNIGDDDVDSEQLGAREQRTGVDDNDVVAAAKGQHVHAEFAQPSGAE